MTIEFLDSANQPLALPAQVRVRGIDAPLIRLLTFSGRARRVARNETCLMKLANETWLQGAQGWGWSFRSIF